MSLRSFFLWFWGIVLASFTAGGATLAMFHERAVPPPAAPIQLVAMTEPLPVPPVPATEEAAGARAAPAWRPHPRVISARPSHAGGEERRGSEFARAARVTVVPPVPPAHVAPANETVAHVSRLPALRPPERTETRTTTWTTPAPAAEPRPRIYAYTPRYTRYSYYTYSYRPYYSYPYSYYYSYAY